MSSDKLRQHLIQLHRELQDVDAFDEETAGLLGTLMQDIAGALAREGLATPADHGAPLGEQLGSAIERLEETHPRLVATMRDVSGMLSNLGI